MSAVVQRIRTIPSWQVTLGIALAALGFLVAAQLASEPPRVRYTTQERAPLVETVLTLQSQQDALKSQILDLRARIQALEQEGQGSQALVQQLNDELDEARIAAGLIALKGPGIVFQLEDSPRRVPTNGNPSDYLVSADDVRILVAQLWLTGAEAVAVNGERVIQSTAIIDIGGSILVNSAYLAPPYQVSAIGPKNLYSRLSASPEFVAFVRSRSETFGIKLSFAEPPSVDIPAFAGTINLRNARIGPGPSPSPSP